MATARLLQADAQAWESYRLHQRDVLLSCFEDADLILRRVKPAPSDEERRLVVQLLFDKRCQPWKWFRDEQRALVRR